MLFIGLGSLAFHLYADSGTALADVVPIAVFMLVYLGFALNRFLGVPPGLTVLLVIGFTAIMAHDRAGADAGTGASVLPGPEMQGAKPCLNGSMFYLPALIALIVVGLLCRGAGAPGRALGAMGGGDLRHLHHAQVARFRALRPGGD